MFTQLPIDVLYEISTHFGYDDYCTFRLLCKTTATLLWSGAFHIVGWHQAMTKLGETDSPHIFNEAIENGNKFTVEKLLNRGYVADDYSLYLAIIRGQIDILKLFWDYGYPFVSMSFEHAVGSNQTKMAVFLHNQGYHAYDWTKIHDSWEFEKQHVLKPKHANCFFKLSQVDYHDWGLDFAMTTASENGNLELVKMINECDICFKHKDESIQHATENNHTHVLEYLK